ncbi:MAG: 1-deoxy-D-xylulose-5-phosphate synthase [Clostridia bacterium]|nr:1-deoxy-D-xylulose-5-phosphate synthase [Clostridia bacterium]
MSDTNMIEVIKSKKVKELGPVCDEIRQKIIEAVSKNGGHLSSNLGMVEPTIALHRVFNSPNDKFVFDVGHQCYAHKIITGRGDALSLLRQFDGVSGFPNRSESEHDVLNEGHSGTSISAALGIAEANKLLGKDDYTIAIIGDGSLTNGMVYEALNNCAGKDLKLIILVNDNEMSISKNVGGLHNYFSKVRVSKRYFIFKRRLKKGFRWIPLLGKPITRLLAGIKNFFGRMLVKNNVFEDLGLEYLGPVNGNNLKKVVGVLEEAKTRSCPTVVHIRTKKGYGYEPAEKEPGKYHGVGRFDIENGINEQPSESFSYVAGKKLVEMAESDEKICAITAAMCDGTGLTPFAEKLPNRLYDVGIAEEHAITFATGLSVSGMKPVVVLYSTFAQRTFDQALHDIAIQGLPMTLLLDRSGIVGGDGITHQGIFDYPMFSSIPGVNIYSPQTYSELEECIEKAVNSEKFDIIRYPKGKETKYKSSLEMIYDEKKTLAYSSNIEKATRVIVTYGRITSLANEVAEGLGDCAVIKLIKIFPLDIEKIATLLNGKELAYVLEESTKTGGVGEKLQPALNKAQKVYIHAIDGFVEHGELNDLYNFCGFTRDNIINNIKKLT